MRLVKYAIRTLGSLAWRIRTIVPRFQSSVSADSGKPPRGPAFASLMHATCAWSGDDPRSRRRVATVSQYGAFGSSMRSADWPPWAQSMAIVLGLRDGSAFAKGTNALNSWVAL